MEQREGLIAILDALGAAVYSDQEIAQFLNSRALVLRLLAEKAESKAIRGDIDAKAVTTFTFNDTVLIVYRTESFLPREHDGRAPVLLVLGNPAFHSRCSVGSSHW